MATLFDPLAYERGAQAAQEANWRDALNQMRLDTSAEALRQSQETFGLNLPIAQQQAQLTGELLNQQGLDLAAQRRAAETQTQLLGEVAGLNPAEQAQRIADRISGRLTQLAQTPGDRSAQSEIRAYQDYIQRLAAGYDQARDFDSAARLRGIFAGTQGQSPLQQNIATGTALNAAYQRGERFFFDPNTGRTMVLPENPAVAQAQLTAQNAQVMQALQARGLGDRFIQVGGQLMMLPQGVPTAAPAVFGPALDAGMGAYASPTGAFPVPVEPAGMPTLPAPAPAPAASPPLYSLNSTNVPAPAAVPIPLSAGVPGPPVAQSIIQQASDALGYGDALRLNVNDIPESSLLDATRRFGPGAKNVLLGPRPTPVQREELVNWLRKEMELTRRLNQLRTR